MKKPALWLLFAGTLFMSSTLVIRHYVHVTDFIDGILKGIGIGLMILALINQKKIKRRETL